MPGSAAGSAESFLTDLVRASRVPGIQYLALNAAGIVFEYAGGWADIRHRLPIEPATSLMAYSMSKTITAAAVLQLVAAGKIGLDDPVERSVDPFPYGSRVTVRQVLAHTSTIRTNRPSAGSSARLGALAGPFRTSFVRTRRS
jgi:CubicO group peptidase (beta-lactamase class C family)